MTHYDDHQEFVDRKRAKRMNEFDSLPADIRQAVNDYGFHVVKAFMDCGITKARRIRHLVECVLDEFSPTRGTSSNQGIRNSPGIDAKEWTDQR